MRACVAPGPCPNGRLHTCLACHGPSHPLASAGYSARALLPARTREKARDRAEGLSPTAHRSTPLRGATEQRQRRNARATATRRNVTQSISRVTNADHIGRLLSQAYDNASQSVRRSRRLTRPSSLAAQRPATKPTTALGAQPTAHDAGDRAPVNHHHRRPPRRPGRRVQLRASDPDTRLNTPGDVLQRLSACGLVQRSMAPGTS